MNIWLHQASLHVFRPCFITPCLWLIKVTLFIMLIIEAYRERETKNINKFSSKVTKTLKTYPEGSRGPIRPGVVPLVLSSLWLNYCIKKIVIMWVLKSDLFTKSDAKNWEHSRKISEFSHKCYSSKLVTIVRASLKTGGIPVWVWLPLKGGPYYLCNWIN